MTHTIPITVSFGDGIGPEIMTSTLTILRYAKVPISVHMVEIGQRAYHHGFRYGIPASCMDTIMKHRTLLKAPHCPPPTSDYAQLNLPEYLHCDERISQSPDPNSVYISNGLTMQALGFIGKDYAVFEPEHSELSELADQDRVNPTAMILAAIMMLRHLALHDHAHTIKQALHQTLADGYRTADMESILPEGTTIVGTTAFTQAIIERLLDK